MSLTPLGSGLYSKSFLPLSFTLRVFSSDAPIYTLTLFLRVTPVGMIVKELVLSCFLEGADYN